MEIEIKPIEIKISDDRYFQAVAILVDNQRFLKKVIELRSQFILGDKFKKAELSQNLWVNNINKSENLTTQFGFPINFRNIIYSAIIKGRVTNEEVEQLKSINWSVEYQKAKKYKNTALAGYFCQKPFEKKKIANFRKARDWYWQYIPDKFGYLKMAEGNESLKETIRSAIRSYKKLITY